MTTIVGARRRLHPVTVAAVTENRRGEWAGGSARWHDGPVRLRPVLVATVLALAMGLAVAAPPVAVHAAAAGSSSDDTSSTVADDSTSSTFAENPFIPEDRNLGDCVSSVPRPDCGTKAHGGWRQGIVFIVLMVGMAFIGWRIFRAVRRADREQPDVPV